MCCVSVLPQMINPSGFRILSCPGQKLPEELWCLQRGANINSKSYSHSLASVFSSILQIGNTSIPKIITIKSLTLGPTHRERPGAHCLVVSLLRAVSLSR